WAAISSLSTSSAIGNSYNGKLFGRSLGVEHRRRLSKDGGVLRWVDAPVLLRTMIVIWASWGALWVDLEAVTILSHSRWCIQKVQRRWLCLGSTRIRI